MNKNYLNISSLKALLSWQTIGVFLGLSSLHILFSHWRWVLLLRHQSFHAPYIESIPLTLIGLFFSFAIPGSVSGDVVKAYYLAKQNPQRKMDSAASVFVDRLCGLFIMLLLSLTSFIFSWDVVVQSSDLMRVFYSEIVIVTLFVLGWVFALSDKVAKIPLFQKILKLLPQVLQKLYFSVNSYRQHIGALLQAFFWSLSAQLISIFFMIYVGHTLGGEIPLSTYFFAVPVGFMISSIPISPAGIGVGQIAFFMLFKMHSGLETSISSTAITAFQITMFSWALLGAYFYLRYKPKEVNHG